MLKLRFKQEIFQVLELLHMHWCPALSNRRQNKPSDFRMKLFTEGRRRRIQPLGAQTETWNGRKCQSIHSKFAFISDWTACLLVTQSNLIQDTFSIYLQLFWVAVQITLCILCYLVWFPCKLQFQIKIYISNKNTLSKIVKKTRTCFDVCGSVITVW